MKLKVLEKFLFVLLRSKDEKELTIFLNVSCCYLPVDSACTYKMAAFFSNNSVGTQNSHNLNHILLHHNSFFRFKDTLTCTFKAYRLLYVPPCLKFKKILHADYIAFMYFVRISEQTATFALYCINSLAFITEVESVYCAVRIESLYNTDTIRL